MIDTDGLMGTSCDCWHFVGTRCLPTRVIERNHMQLDELVVEGEEPPAFLLYSNYKGLICWFSVVTEKKMIWMKQDWIDDDPKLLS